MTEVNDSRQLGELFDDWIVVKKELHRSNRTQAMKEGGSLVVCDGRECRRRINGKNEVFSRPVLIFKKLSRFAFMGVPLSSQEHEGSWYIPFIFQNKNQNACLAQIRVMSVARLYRKMGRLPESDQELIKDGFARLYLGPNWVKR